MNQKTARRLAAAASAGVFVLAVLASARAGATSPEEDGRLPGDDKPATVRCFLTEDEIADLVYGYDESQEIEGNLLARATRVDNVTVTYYCCEQYSHICGTGDGITSSGSQVTPDVSIAVPSYIPFGSTVILDYGDGALHYYVADDHGAAINGKHVDVAVATHDEALQMGIRKATMYWAPEGDAIE